MIFNILLILNIIAFVLSIFGFIVVMTKFNKNKNKNEIHSILKTQIKIELVSWGTVAFFWACTMILMLVFKEEIVEFVIKNF